jgi:hypothetical protein
VEAAGPEPIRGTPTNAGPLVWYTNDVDGYRMLLPESWAAGATAVMLRGEPFPGVQKFGIAGNSFGYQGLTISIGEPDGTVLAMCEVAACQEFHASTLDELQEVLVSTPPLISNQLPITDRFGSLTLDGEPGGWERSGIGNHGLGAPWAMYHVFAIRDGRPVVLAFDEWNIRFDRLTANTRALVNEMVASFEFLDPGDDQASPDEIYRAELPTGFRRSMDFYPGATTYFAGSQVVAMIFHGGPDGSIKLCQFGPCQTIVTGTIDDQRAALQVTSPLGYPGGSGSMFESAGDAVVTATTLGGEPAERKSANTSPGWLLGPTMYDWVYTIHDGRPVAIRLDHWARGGGSRAGLAELVASFEFVD